MCTLIGYSRMRNIESVASRLCIQAGDLDVHVPVLPYADWTRDQLLKRHVSEIVIPTSIAPLVPALFSPEAPGHRSLQSSIATAAMARHTGRAASIRPTGEVPISSFGLFSVLSKRRIEECLDDFSSDHSLA